MGHHLFIKLVFKWLCSVGVLAFFRKIELLPSSIFIASQVSFTCLKNFPRLPQSKFLGAATAAG